MLFYILIFGILNFDFATQLCVKRADFSSRDHEFEGRPNLFIDNDLLENTAHQRHQYHGFGYGSGPLGPAHWSNFFSKCSGKSQSPIDIDLPTLQHVKFPPLTWNDVYKKVPGKMTLINNGHTIQLKVYYNNNTKPIIEGGPLQRSYTLENLHFHWGSANYRGSEHTINKKLFPLEMHVVHSRTDLNLSKAEVTAHGLVVVAYIFEIQNRCNPALSNILSVFDKIKLEHDVPEELFNLFTLDKLLDRFTKEYVTYNGSITTPPCFETVTWIISPYAINISKQQLDQFRSLYRSTKGLVDNFRPQQPLNKRHVFFVQ